MLKYTGMTYIVQVMMRDYKDGEECINLKTLVYQKGVDYIRKIVLNSDNNFVVIK